MRMNASISLVLWRIYGTIICGVMTEGVPSPRFPSDITMPSWSNISAVSRRASKRRLPFIGEAASLPAGLIVGCKMLYYLEIMLRFLRIALGEGDDASSSSRVPIPSWFDPKPKRTECLRLMLTGISVGVVLKNASSVAKSLPWCSCLIACEKLLCCRVMR